MVAKTICRYTAESMWELASFGCQARAPADVAFRVDPDMGTQMKIEKRIYG